MKKLRERLNKKGFTLVELIVVIVIILILAAALVPNVMRYIGQAREASFKSDASAYLVEIQGYAAEIYAKYDMDLTDSADPGVTVGTDTVKKFLVGKVPADNPSADDEYTYALSGFKDGDTATGEVSNTKTAYPDLTSVGTYGKKTIQYVVYHGAVKAFTYVDGKYGIKWSQTAGWDKELKK